MERWEKKSFSYILIDIVLLLFTCVLQFSQTESISLVLCTATITYIFMICSWIKQCKSFLNFFTLFLVLAYIYTYGQYILKVFDINIMCQFTIDNVYSYVQINDTALYFITNIIVLHISVLFFSNTTLKLPINFKIKGQSFFSDIKLNINNNQIEIGQKSNVYFYFLSMLLLLFSFVCEMLVLSHKIKINMTLGYAEALKSSYNGAGPFSHIIRFVATLFIPAVFAAFISSKGRKKEKYVWMAYAIYLVLYFISGSRFEAVISLAGVVLLYNYYYKKINGKKLFLLFIIGMLVLYLCALITNIRIIDNYGIYSDFSQVVSESIKLTNKNNFVVDVVSVAGMQILSNTAVYEHCPADIDFSYGEYYLGGILRVIPNILGGENMLISASIDNLFTKYLTKTYGMGSSFVIEAYYNFGYFGVLMMVPYGALVSYVCKIMNRIQNNECIDEIKKYFVFYISSTALFYIRSDCRMLLREIVFYYIGIRLMTWILKNILLVFKKRC